MKQTSVLNRKIYWKGRGTRWPKARPRSEVYRPFHFFGTELWGMNRFQKITWLDSSCSSFFYNSICVLLSRERKDFQQNNERSSCKVERLAMKRFPTPSHPFLGRVGWSVVNLSFSFRTPSTSSYLLVGVKEREDRRLPTVETSSQALGGKKEAAKVVLSISHGGCQKIGPKVAKFLDR